MKWSFSGIDTARAVLHWIDQLSLLNMQQNEVEIVISDHCGSELDSDDDKSSEEVNCPFVIFTKNDFNWFEYNLVHH